MDLYTDVRDLLLNKQIPIELGYIGVINRSRIDWAENKCDFYTPPTAENAKKYKKQDHTWRIQNAYLLDTCGNAKIVYQRIFIRKKH